jgi:hypothetical protein
VVLYWRTESEKERKRESMIRKGDKRHLVIDLQNITNIKYTYEIRK